MPQPLTQVLTYSRTQPLGCVTAAQLLGLQRMFPHLYPVLFQSAATTHGHHHDVLMAFPQQRLTLFSNDQLQLPEAIHDYKGASFLDALDLWWHGERVSAASSPLPFSGGWFLFMGYELAAQIESSLRLPSGAAREIVAQAVRIPAAIIRDTMTSEAWFVAEDEHVHRVEEVREHLVRLHQDASSSSATLVSELCEEMPEIFLDAVNKALLHIAAGDIYQANLSRGWRATLQQPACAQDVYQRLCDTNPAPFAGLALLSGDEAVISSSPERLISIRGGEVSTRPIAGTRPRSVDPPRDVQLIEELRDNPKEQAEHIMLLDLERNDLGRICKAGTVQVDEFMTVESYAHVHHIVSNVRGQLCDEITPGQAIAAVFPGGTITGCPKIRCMQIISALESVRRGPYTGSMGYLNRDGSMDLNILIRSLHLRKNQLEFRAGAGIVADSVAERELEETRAKALGMLRALGAAS